MSNLGAYQWITSASKKVGGPVNLLLLTGVTGAAIYKTCEIGVKKGIQFLLAHQDSPTVYRVVKKNVYTVTTDGMSNEGTEFLMGTKFKVLEKDGDTVLIEKIGDNNNPYFVSSEFLRTISDFKE